MAKKSSYPTGTSKDDETILSQAIERYDLAWEGEEENVTAAYDDLKFLAGEQWPDEIAQQRQKERRPMLTISKLDQYVHQVTGDMRMNTPAIKVRPAGSGATSEIAQIFDGLIRNIEANSDADTVYIQAGESQARCGVGAIMLETDYTDDDAFEQDIRLCAVPDPLNILWDPDSRKLTREDANWCFLVRRMTYDKFKACWPEAKISSWDEARTLAQSDTWFNPRELRIAWYWVKTPVTKTLGQMADGSTVDMAKHKGEPPLKTRKVESHKVVRYTVTAAEVLEVKDWAGKYIPVIPVIGEEINVGDRTVRRGLIRAAKDPQRVYNYEMTTSVETHALAPKAPFIATVDMIKGQEKMWRQANTRNLPYLLYTPDKLAPTARPERSQASTDISTSLALAQQATEDMHQATGIYPSALGQKSNEMSGKAVIARQKESDVGTFLYIDNLSKAIAYIGKQLVDLIPKIYDTSRRIRILGEDGTEQMVDINQPIPGEVDQLFNDLSLGKYDVIVETGPSFSTRRAESAQAMMEFVTMAPDKAAGVLDLVVDALDWPNKDKFKERLQMMLPPGIDPEVDAFRAQFQPPQQPDPVAMAFAEESKAKAVKAIADAGTAQQKQKAATFETVAKVRQMAAETTGQELENAQAALELSLASGQLGEIIRQMVASELRGFVQVQNGMPPINPMDGVR